MSELFRFSENAMATAFEVIIAHDPAETAYAAQAAEAVFSEIHKLEEELSRFRHTSDIWRLGNLKAGQSLGVTMAVWDCLRLAQQVHQETGGAFDVTVGPLMQIWRQEDGSLRDEPDPALLELARGSVGGGLYRVAEDDCSVTVLADHMVFDLGAVGKGYALDQAAEILQAWSIPNALLNAGDSTLLALGAPPGEEAWTVSLADGAQVMTLRDRALSGSGFMVKGAHIMNPRTLRPVPVRPQRSYALAPTAALSDALSTAFMVMAPEEITALCARNPGLEWLEI